MLSGEVQSNQQDGSSVSDKVHYDNRTLELLKRQMHMSDSTWRKVIAADPTGWAATLGYDSAQSPTEQSDLSTSHASPINAPSSLPDAYTGDAGDECEE